MIYLFVSVTNTANISPGLGWLDPECLENIQKKNLSCVQKYKHSFGQAPAKKPTGGEEEFGCGQRKVAAANIVGGEASQPGEWPWMAKLVYTRSDQATCSGTLVSRKHVVTAGHCVAELVPDMVRLGDTIISTEYDCFYPEDCLETEEREASSFYGSKKCYLENECAPRHVDIRVTEVHIHDRFHVCPDSSCFPKFDVALLSLETRVPLSEYIQVSCH